MNLDRTFSIPETVIAQTIAGETVIIDLSGGLYFSLDPIGTRIWELLAQGASMREIATQMHAEYDVSRDTLECDVVTLGNTLLAKSLVIENT